MDKFILKDYQENPIHVYKYEPKDTPKAVVHIVHGAAEHFARYGLFAEYLTKNGYLVIGCDFLGHGLSAKTLDYVHYADKHGDILAYESIVLVKEYIEENYKELPIYLIGHSMGSFLSRKLILDFPDSYDKVILSGTGNAKKGLVNMGRLLINLMRPFKGPKYVSKLVDNLSMGGYPELLKKEGIISKDAAMEEWLTRDEEIQKYYHNSEMCGQPFTIQAYYDLLTWVKDVINPKNIDNGNKKMPIYLMSGSNDPVSNLGKEVKELYDLMVKLGYENVKMKLYLEARHEILNEINRDEVYKDMLDFLDE